MFLIPLKYKLHLFLLIAIITCYSSGTAQTKFQSFNIKNGLSNSTVSHLYQDSQGYMWIGTGRGVDLFTGKYFIPLKQFISDSLHTTTVAITAIIELPKNDIWVGTWGDGVFHVNIETGKYEHFKADTLLSKYTISDNYINCFYKGTDDKLWIGTVYGLCSYNGNGEFDNYVFTEVLENGFADIRAIIPRYGNLLTLFTYHGEVIELNIDSGSFQKVGTLPESKTGIKCVHQDHQQNFWIGTEYNGIYKINKNYSPLDLPASVNDLFNGTEITRIINHPNGDILIATDGLGIIQLSEPDYSLSYIQHAPFFPNSLANNQIQDILIDSNGNLWVAHFKAGFSKANLNTDGISHYYRNELTNNELPNNIVNCFAEQPDNDNLWIGTEKGLTIWNKKLKQFVKGTSFTQKVIQEIGKNPITALQTDTFSQCILVGTFNKGMYKINLKDQTITNYNNHNSELQSNFIRYFAQTNADEYLIASVDGGILKYFKGAINKINVYHENGFEIRDFFHILNIDGHTTWLSSAGGGLILLDRDNYKGQMFQGIITEISYTSLLSSDSVLYCGTNKGAFTYNSKQNDFERLPYISSETEVYGIIEDQFRYLWFSTSNGLFRYHPKTNTWEMVNSSNLQGYEFQPGSYLKLSDGRLAFGGINGFNIIDPSRFSFIPSNQQIFISGLSFYNQPIKVGKKIGHQVVLDRQANFVETIHVPHHVDLFNITPYNINYQYLDPGKFAYSISEDNTPGKPVITENVISFHNLKPGHYHLEIFPVNPFTHEPDFSSGKSLTILKATPWWRSTLFIVGLILTCILVIFTLYRMRVINHRRVRIQLEQMVRAQTTDLIQKKKELTHQRDELQKTLDQNLKLENFKEALISMIVHDLKNPLNGIIGLSSLNEPEYLERIHNVSQQMLYMVENILDVRKYENHSLKIFHQQTDIREVVEEAIGDVNFLITDNNIQIVNTMDHIITSFDRDIIKRVYVNLLTNAIKFSPTRGTITLEGSYRMVSDQKQLILSIKDQGKGIPKEFQEDIFDLYKQVKIKKSGKATSTGLGLSFCKIAVEAHRGEIWVESDANAGSTFIFSLPA